MGDCQAPTVMDCTNRLFWYLGFMVSVYIIFRLLLSLWRGIYTCILADLLGFSVDWKTVGKWAVITGATDGIGNAYVNALAKKGLNIVLISRNPDKLEAVAKEIEKKYQVKTQVIAVDFTDERKIYDDIKEALKNVEVGVLVNNVGMSYRYAEYLTKIENVEKFSDDVIKMNIISCTRMTEIVLPQMEKRRKGVIINISSLSALFPVPLLSLYSACKAYVNFFTRGIQDEYKTKGIIIQSVLPGFVSTNMSKMRPSLTTCTPEAFVKWSLKTVGVEDKTYGYPAHKAYGYVQEMLSALPEQLILAIGHHMMNKIRVRYYKKFGLVDTESRKKDPKDE